MTEVPDMTPELPNGQRITEDCPCANCGQNLRGLTPEDFCPACQEPVATTLALMVDEVLCTSCMKPSPAVATRCVHCGADLTTAGVNANVEAGKPLMPSVLLKSEDTLEDRVAHARSRMWIGLVFFGPFFLVSTQLAGDTIRHIARGPVEFFSSIGNVIAFLLFAAIFGGLAYLLYFLITRYWDLKGQLDEANENAKPDNASDE